MVYMAADKLKDAYWDPKRKDKLVRLMQQYQPGDQIESSLQQEYIADKFVLTNNTIELEVVFDKKFIGFVIWLMFKKDVDQRYMHLLTELQRHSSEMIFEMDEQQK